MPYGKTGSGYYGGKRSGDLPGSLRDAAACLRVIRHAISLVRRLRKPRR